MVITRKSWGRISGDQCEVSKWPKEEVREKTTKTSWLQLVASGGGSKRRKRKKRKSVTVNVEES